MTVAHRCPLLPGITRQRSRDDCCRPRPTARRAGPGDSHGPRSIGTGAAALEAHPSGRGHSDHPDNPLNTSTSHPPRTPDGPADPTQRRS
jgi:hypothetical protein